MAADKFELDVSELDGVGSDELFGSVLTGGRGFTFDDLIKVDPGGIQTLLRQVEKEQLALALKGASDEVKDLFFSNMSERAAKILREDMASMGPVRLKDVDTAQSNMVNLAKDLAAKGEILIADGGGEDELIY